VDEIVGRGANRIAVVSQGAITVTELELPPAEAAWRRAVRHRVSHTANAAVLLDALSPCGNPHICDLVERNSAAILATSSPELDPDTARCEVRDAPRIRPRYQPPATTRLHTKGDPAMTRQHMAEAPDALRDLIGPLVRRFDQHDSADTVLAAAAYGVARGGHGASARPTRRPPGRCR